MIAPRERPRMPPIPTITDIRMLGIPIVMVTAIATTATNTRR
jgi:hypothetical protein